MIFPEPTKRSYPPTLGASTVSLGIDPDTTTPAFALLRSRGPLRPPEILWAGLATVDENAPIEKRIIALAYEVPRMVRLAVLKGYEPAVLVVESQRKYPHDKVSPQDLIHLGQVAGICLAAVQAVREGQYPMECFFPYPSDWKGNADKKIMQTRYLTRVGLESPKELVANLKIPGSVTIRKAGLVSHVADAIGLAWYGLEKLAPNQIPAVKRYGS